MNEQIRYGGSVYIGVVGGDFDYGSCRDSIERILRHPADAPPRYTRATKGYEARQYHLNNFIDSKHDFILLLDHDMVFEPDTLMKLRSHGLPYVTGAYMRRQFEPVMAPVWFDHEEVDEWPRRPATSVPPEGGLIPVAASGWGCVLIHRDVILAVRELLKGEWEVIEDDMDVWPYSLDNIMAALNGLQELVDTKPGLRVLRPALKEYTEVLRQEIRPLRGDNRVVIGSDIRFPFFARQAGYQLMLDPSVAPGHVLHYPLKPSDFAGAGDEYIADVQQKNARHVEQGRKAWRARLEQLRGAIL